MGRPEETVRQQHADLEAPRYSVANVTFVATSDLSAGHAQLPDRPVTCRIGDDRRKLHARIPMNDQSTFTVHLFNEFGHANTEPRINRIHVLEDQPTSVRIAKPSVEAKAASGSPLSVVVGAEDDHGLTRVRDQTSNLPAEVRQQLLGNMSEASPVGWEQRNRVYFQRLSGDASAADPEVESAPTSEIR